MLTALGQKFTDLFTKFMPNSFVFALLLTLISGCLAMIFMGSSLMGVIAAWYEGFFDLLAFGMQITLIVITGYSIALSPIIGKLIDRLSDNISSPRQVYLIVAITGGLLSLVSFGWIVITAVLARELALRVKGIHYTFLVACVYLSGSSWVCGLSSSIPLLLNTDKNFLIESNILTTIIPTSYTLGSTLNYVMLALFLCFVPVMILFIIPKGKTVELTAQLQLNPKEEMLSIEEEAKSYSLPFKAFSDILNNSQLLQALVAFMGLAYIVYYFIENGFDLNFNIMIFIFIIAGLLLHKTPMQYSIAMKRSSFNISGILFQYPFYAGIMGIMIYTGLGEQAASAMASVATLDSYPIFAFFTGAIMNFAIPSAGGEFAVVGPSIIHAVQEIGSAMPAEELQKMISKACISVAYGESLSNLLQPFFLLLVFPVMGQGIKIQARDVMGYLVIPFMVLLGLQLLLISLIPV